MGLLNAIFVWFIVPYLLMYSFLRYFEVSRQARQLLRAHDGLPG